MSGSSAVAPLRDAVLNSPFAEMVVAEVQAALDDERRRRRGFYETMRESDKAEFINGEIVHQSPVKVRHERASSKLVRVLSVYVDHHRLGYVGHEKLLVSLSRNDYEPDVSFFGPEKAAKLEPDQMHLPAPDFVAEVLSPSTEAVDRGLKLQDYAAHGVQEYWIVDPDRESVEQYVAVAGAFDLQTKTTSGTIESVAVPGFSISVRALFDDQANLDAVRGILAG